MSFLGGQNNDEINLIARARPDSVGTIHYVKEEEPLGKAKYSRRSR